MKKFYLLTLFIIIVNVTNSFGQYSPYGWNQIELYIGTYGLVIPDSVYYKMEAIGPVWDVANNLTTNWHLSYFPPNNPNTPIIEKTINVDWITLHQMEWQGYEFANTGNMYPPMESYGYGLYKLSATITTSLGEIIDGGFIYLDYTDTNYPYNFTCSTSGHPADLWIKYDASNKIFSYSSYAIS